MNKTAFTSIVLSVIVLFVGGFELLGQNCIDLGGASPNIYTQNFDGFGSSPSPQNSDAANVFQLNPSAPRRYLGKFDNAIADSGATVNVPGWAIVEEGSNTSSVTGRYNSSDGSASGGNTYSFASAVANTDLALGSLNDDTISTNYLGGCFRNATGGTALGVRIGYIGEMWRLGGSGAPDRLDFQYAVNATNTFNGSFLDLNSFDFTTPSLAGSAGGRDGNVAPNRTAFTVTNVLVTLAPNDTLHVRWIDSNIAGADDGLAIDDFSIQILIPSAANASIAGRVLTSNGRGIARASVTISGPNGVVKSSLTNSFGYYKLEDIAVGQTYIVGVSSKRYEFIESTRALTLHEDLSGFDFTAQP